MADLRFIHIEENFKGYTPPLRELRPLDISANVCPGCVVKGGPNNYWGAVSSGKQMWEDAHHWYVCTDCYRDLLREGKVW